MQQGPIRLKRVVIKEELVALTGDYVKAILLNQFLYWSERVDDFDLFILEEQQRARDIGKELNIELRQGWIYKKAEDLSEETMLNMSKTAIGNHIKSLIDAGWIEQRRNPRNKMDKTYQYRVNIANIQRDLMRLGYSLEGYRVPLDIIVSVADDLRSPENELRSPLNGLRSQENGLRSFESGLRSPFCGQQYQRLHTEIKDDEDEEDRAHARADEFQFDTVRQPDCGIVDDDVPFSSAEIMAAIQETCAADKATHHPSATLPSAWTSEDDPYIAIDQRMMMHLGRPYIAKENDYRAIKQLLESGVPMDFILAGIDYTFATFADRRPRSFAYCAEVIKERWAAELAKRQPVEAVNWVEYCQDSAKRQPSPSPQRTSKPRTSQPARKERIRDERYAAFYELFPDG
ncbi:transcriptional regulator [Alicyclobacillus mali]|uniref:Transcriptional regulator n=1 Tax=Alicyclobacillus mali (ex Roth et al. 2021) TaxID=1123961 RepID=A0ABS0EZK4_9BACL|nr:transcriptional regulator [Alicyclobacillus mali (ex Roth et al. 2021)]MBF8376483.1 transcriptional regulator [Alicyclobacillus mali (ex Roth et al. 2021)]